jgi:aspartate aminotransferase
MLNPRVTALTKSTTLKITALTKKLKKEGKDVVNFAGGEPDFDTPSFVKEAAKKAIDEGFTKYTPSAGIPQLRAAIAKKLQDENKIPAKESNIIVTTGAKYALFAAIFAVVSEGQEIIIPSPYWVSYPQMAILAGAKIKYLLTTLENNFKISPSDLKKSINSNTKLLILNYPSNPSGITYDYDELKAIYEIAKENNIFVLSDEIYEKLIYDGRSHTSFASFPGADKFTITVNGFSKSFSMTGWRMGYLCAHEDLVDQISKIIDHTTSCACSITQQAALAALQDKKWQEESCQEFEKRRNLLYEGLSKLKKISAIKSESTFYMFCDIRKTGLSSMEFSSKLLEEQLVSCIPADAFGAEGFVRLSFATSSEQIKKGIERIEKFLKRL